MKREILVTGDGSATIAVTSTKLTFHSVNGAIQESMHVFIEAGLRPMSSTEKSISIFEMGFGTGLNALLTLLESQRQQKSIHYTAIEAYPLENSLVQQLNYCEQLKRPDMKNVFSQMHDSAWEEEDRLSPLFTLHKIKSSLAEYSGPQQFNLIFFDAFAPDEQPELWTTGIFEMMFKLLLPGGILVTYSSKGAVRRSMETAGFVVEKLPGATGKREMLRALRI